MKKVATLEFLNYPKFSISVLAYLDELLNTIGLEKKRAIRLRLACEEIIMRRMEEAFKEEGTLYVDIYLSDTEIEFSLRDKGEPYYISELDFDKNNIDNSLQGIETFLMHEMVDTVGMEKLGWEGQRIFLRIATKLLPIPEKITHTQDEPKDKNFSIRLVGEFDKDINTAISCIYHEYGYTYLYEPLYYYENFKKMLESKKFFSYLIVNDHDEVAGHFALSESDEYTNLPEISTVVIERRFRGCKIGNLSFEYGEQASRDMGKKGICVQPTAFHTITQHISLKYGYCATGFVFHYINADVSSEYNKEGKRLDLCMAVKLFEPQSIKICCPNQIESFVSNRLNALNINWQIEPCKDPTGESEVTMNINTKAYLTKIVVKKVGIDFDSVIGSLLHTCNKNKSEVAELLINLSETAVQSAYTTLLKHGFMFSGIMPGSENGVFCIMQHLFGEEPNFDGVVTEGEFTNVLEELKQIYEGGEK